MSSYRVMWEIDVDADHPVGAAMEAQRIQRDPESTATTFVVTGPSGLRTVVDTSMADPTVKVNLYLPAKKLRLADVLDLGHPWGTAIVKRIEDGFVTVWRPYGTTASFSTTGGAICYVGLEEFKVPTSGDTLYTVVQRTELM